MSENNFLKGDLALAMKQKNDLIKDKDARIYWNKTWSNAVFKDLKAYPAKHSRTSYKKTKTHFKWALTILEVEIRMTGENQPYPDGKLAIKVKDITSNKYLSLNEGEGGADSSFYVYKGGRKKLKFSNYASKDIFEGNQNFNVELWFYPNDESIPEGLWVLSESFELKR